MGKQFLSFVFIIIPKTFLLISLVIISNLMVNAQAVYVDSNTGNDNNNGTIQSPFFSIQKALEIIKNKDNDIYVIKINPGIYIPEKPLVINTEKETISTMKQDLKRKTTNLIFFIKEPFIKEPTTH